MEWHIAPHHLQQNQSTREAMLSAWLCCTTTCCLYFVVDDTYCLLFCCWWYMLPHAMYIDTNIAYLLVVMCTILPPEEDYSFGFWTVVFPVGTSLGHLLSAIDFTCQLHCKVHRFSYNLTGLSPSLPTQKIIHTPKMLYYNCVHFVWNFMVIILCWKMPYFSSERVVLCQWHYPLNEAIVSLCILLWVACITNNMYHSQQIGSMYQIGNMYYGLVVEWPEKIWWLQSMY